MLKRYCFNLPFSVDLIKSYKGHLKTIEIRPLFEPSMKNSQIPIHLVVYSEIGKAQSEFSKLNSVSRYALHNTISFNLNL